MLDRPRVRSGMFNMRPGTFRSVLLCIKYYTCTYLYETRTKINIDILDCTHLCSGSASDTYIRRELAPHKRYNVCTRFGVFMLVWSHTGFLQTDIYSSKLCHSVIVLACVYPYFCTDLFIFLLIC